MTKLYINNTLLDAAFDENKIDHFEYKFMKKILDNDKFAEYGEYAISEKQSKVLERVFPKLYEGTVYAEEEEKPIRASVNSDYTYRYDYDYEPSDAELQAIEREAEARENFTSKPFQSIDPSALLPSHHHKDQ